MTGRIKSDRIVRGDVILSGYIYFEDGVITTVSPEEYPADIQYDMSGHYVMPGLIDLHTHGGNGHEFFGEPEDIAEACRFHLLHGTTAICPTVSSAPFALVEHTLSAVREAARRNMIPTFAGLHLEGPYLSPEMCGAQNAGYLAAPAEEDYVKLLEDADGLIVRWTYAPELDPEGTFCDCLVSHGVLPSAGHTNATYKDMDIARHHGCRMITHLFNCTSTVRKVNGYRTAGVVESAWLHDDLFAEVIADGRHVPPELLRMTVKIKGCDHVVLCTDSLAMTGTDARSGRTLDTEYRIEDGVCKRADGGLAGSIATADRLIRVMVKEAGFPVQEAVKMMTQVPAGLLGLKKGQLEAGYDADIVVMDSSLHVTDVFLKGRRVE